MKSDIEKVLGRYSFIEGGSIILKMGANMELGTEVGTHIHEVNHMHLTNMSSIGQILLILELERILAKEVNDDTQSKRMKKYTEVINNKTIDVHEIYANNMELLLISEIGKGEFTNNLYEMKPDKYKTYIDFMNIISKDSSLTFDEKRCLIHKLCVYAMSPPVLSEDFINSLKSYKSLMHYFNGENHPKKRLKKALEFYTSGQDIKNESAIQLYDGNFLDILKNNNVTKYINDVWNKYRDTYDYLLTDNHLTIEEIKKKYYQDIENRIKVFDISACKINRDYCFDKQISNSFFIIKNCENLYNKNNFYIIGHTYDKDESIYVSKEISSKELNILIQESECIMIDLHEYDMEKCCPKYFSAGDKPIIVLINDYADCYQWFKGKRSTMRTSY